jgi:hypothetical protein
MDISYYQFHNLHLILEELAEQNGLTKSEIQEFEDEVMVFVGELLINREKNKQ